MDQEKCVECGGQGGSGGVMGGISFGIEKVKDNRGGDGKAEYL